MRYALVSDIHANLQAWNAVLIDIRSRDIDRMICLGDIVGYGPDPARVLESVHANVDHLVLGNHDAVVCGKMDGALFDAGAREIIDWTRGRLADRAVAFLATLPLTLRAEGFRCAHGEFSDPASYEYIIDPEDALPSWKAVDEQLLFVGHTHRPALFLLGASGTPRMVRPQDFAVEAGKRYIVNVGSTGQPRDGEARASYCVLDTEQRSIYWHWVPFDLDAYRDALAEAGVPAGPSYFLRHDPRKGKPPLRELLSFSPASTPEEAAQDAVLVREISDLQRRVTKWKRLFTVLLMLGLAGASAAATAIWRQAHRAVRIAAPGTIPIRAAATPVDNNMLPGFEAPLPPGAAIPGWRIELGHGRRQSVRTIPHKTGPNTAALTSTSGKDELRIASPNVHVAPGTRLCVEGAFRRHPDFSGNTALVVALRKQVDGRIVTLDPFIVKQPNLPRRGGWMLAKQTFQVPAGTVSLTLEVRSRFTGSIDIKDLSMVRKD